MGAWLNDRSPVQGISRTNAGAAAAGQRMAVHPAPVVASVLFFVLPGYLGL